MEHINESVKNLQKQLYYSVVSNVFYIKKQTNKHSESFHFDHRKVFEEGFAQSAFVEIFCFGFLIINQNS